MLYILVHTTSSRPARDGVIGFISTSFCVPCVPSHLADKWKTSHCNLKQIAEVAHGDLFWRWTFKHMNKMIRWRWVIVSPIYYIIHIDITVGKKWWQYLRTTWRATPHCCWLHFAIVTLCITISRLPMPKVEKLLPLFLPDFNGFSWISCGFNNLGVETSLMKVLDGSVDTPKQPIHRSDLRLRSQVTQVTSWFRNRFNGFGFPTLLMPRMSDVILLTSSCIDNSDLKESTSRFVKLIQIRSRS